MTDQDIIDAAAKISDDTERSQYIDRASQGDTNRRRRLEAKMAEAFQYEKTGEAPLPSSVTMTSAATPPTRHGSPSPFGDSGGGINLTQGAKIGPYKLLQKLGEGGMGSVWMAEQEHPVRRTVALKAIKPGMDSDRVLARFEAERQALALMDHPNIAKVLDAGTTENGCPYFVMELVKGVPVTKFCDDQKLDIKARLELFIPICQAIQHAHQKGIIHRDIKPSNVMVALYDGKPIPKVIDFGIAKATGPKLTDRTIFTEFGTVIGTLEYMAPEQAELNALDIDTRSDIYSLGVMLYELLTGSTPLGRDTLQRAAFAEVIRRIKEEEPPRPSTRLSDSKDSLPGISAQRKAEPAKLPQSIRGDLDWIVMKALAKERDRRYETANNFAIDLMHFLQNEPVTARPPSTVYLLQKFVRRNRAAVASAAVSVLALIAATIVSAAMYQKADAAKVVAQNSQAAEAEQKKKAEDERDKAVAARNQARQTLKCFQEIFFMAPRTKDDRGIRRDVTIKEAIEKNSEKMLTRYLDKYPEAKVSVRNILATECREGTVREVLNADSDSKIDEHLRDHPEAAASARQVLGATYYKLGDLDRAKSQLAKSVELLKTVNKDHRGLLEREMVALINYAQTVADRMDDKKDAMELMNDAIKRSEDAMGPSDHVSLRARSNLANFFRELERFPEAVEEGKKILSIGEAIPQKSKDVMDVLLIAKSNLGIAHHLQKQYDQSVKLLEEVYKTREKDPGLDNLSTIQSAYLLARAYHDSKKNQNEALKLAGLAVDWFQKNQHPDKGEVANATKLLAAIKGNDS